MYQLQDSMDHVIAILQLLHRQAHFIQEIAGDTVHCRHIVIGKIYSFIGSRRRGLENHLGNNFYMQIYCRDNPYYIKYKQSLTISELIKQSLTDSQLSKAYKFRREHTHPSSSKMLKHYLKRVKLGKI